MDVQVGNKSASISYMTLCVRIILSPLSTFQLVRNRYTTIRIVQPLNFGCAYRTVYSRSVNRKRQSGLTNATVTPNRTISGSYDWLRLGQGATDRQCLLRSPAAAVAYGDRSLKRPLHGTL